MKIFKNNEKKYILNNEIYEDARVNNIEDLKKYDYASYVTVDIIKANLKDFKYSSQKLIAFSKYIPLWPFLRELVNNNFYGVQTYSDSIKHTANLAPTLKIILMISGNKIMLDDQRLTDWPGEEWKTKKAHHLIYV